MDTTDADDFADRIRELASVSTYDGWEFSRITETDFVMFENRTGPQYREAGIGPIGDGKWRFYVDKEVSEDPMNYEQPSHVEGSYERVHQAFRFWIVE